MEAKLKYWPVRELWKKKREKKREREREKREKKESHPKITYIPVLIHSWYTVVGFSQREGNKNTKIVRKVSGLGNKIGNRKRRSFAHCSPPARKFFFKAKIYPQIVLYLLIKEKKLLYFSSLLRKNTHARNKINHIRWIYFNPVNLESYTIIIANLQQKPKLDRGGREGRGRGGGD